MIDLTKFEGYVYKLINLVFSKCSGAVVNNFQKNECREAKLFNAVALVKRRHKIPKMILNDSHCPPYNEVIVF